MALHALLAFVLEASSEVRHDESGVADKKLQIVMVQSRPFLSRGGTVLQERPGAAPSGEINVESGRELAATHTDVFVWQVQSSVPVRRPNELPEVGKAERSAGVNYETPFPAQAEMPVPVPEDEGPELADAVRDFRVALASQARRYRVYPLSARENGIGGQSEIEILLQPSRVPALRLVKTSGHEVLDQAALEMLRRSLDSVPIPGRLIGQRLKFSLPVEFIPPQ